jgi:hypothetical protein
VRISEGFRSSHTMSMTRRPTRLAMRAWLVKPAKDGAPSPAAFAWTGTRRLFAQHGFKVVGNREGGKQRVRLTISH